MAPATTEVIQAAAAPWKKAIRVTMTTKSVRRVR
jgi:hypothetical protein